MFIAVMSSSEYENVLQEKLNYSLANNMPRSPLSPCDLLGDLLDVNKLDMFKYTSLT